MALQIEPRVGLSDTRNHEYLYEPPTHNTPKNCDLPSLTSCLKQSRHSSTNSWTGAVMASYSTSPNRVRRTEKQGDSERFFCPFPGCNRSFIDLWRLKVHYRADPDVRGSGRERGHGQELPACPKCGKELERGRHHVNCAAGKAAPSQAHRRAEKVLSANKKRKTEHNGDDDFQHKSLCVRTGLGCVRLAFDGTATAAPSGVHSLATLTSTDPCESHVTTQLLSPQPNRESSLPPRMPGHRPNVKIVPVDTPVFDGQLDSTTSHTSNFSFESYASNRLGGGAQEPAQNGQPISLAVATPAQSLTPKGSWPLNLADCRVTPGYAVFVGSDSNYKLYFVPGDQDAGASETNDAGIQVVNTCGTLTLSGATRME